MELIVRDLGVARGGVPLLAGVEFSLAAGAALVLRGPNGIGKTSLLRVLAGLQPASAGSVLVDREAVAYAGHADGVKSALSVAENLAFWGAVFGQREIGPALRAFALEDLAERPAGMLSAGQKRRLGLARLVVSGRDIWVMDEPTVSLDAASVGLFGVALAGHLARGGIAVMATHIDVGVEAEVLELGAYRAAWPVAADEAFL